MSWEVFHTARCCSFEYIDDRQRLATGHFHFTHIVGWQFVRGYGDLPHTHTQTLTLISTLCMIATSDRPWLAEACRMSPLLLMSWLQLCKLRFLGCVRHLPNAVSICICDAKCLHNRIPFQLECKASSLKSCCKFCPFFQHGIISLGVAVLPSSVAHAMHIDNE